MSCDWDIHCRTCNESMGIDNANHCDAECALVCVNAVQIGHAWTTLQESGISVDLAGVGDYGLELSCFSFKWIAKHAQHDLVPISEYGEMLDRCSEWYSCDHCGMRQRPCSLPKDHEGPHGVAK